MLQDIIRQSYFVQMFQHAQCIVLVLITLALTALGVRSAFIIVTTLIFYALTTYINCFTRLQLRGILSYLMLFSSNYLIPYR